MPDDRVIQVYAAGVQTKKCDACGQMLTLYRLVVAMPGSSGWMVFTGTPPPRRILETDQGRVFEFAATDTHWVSCTRPGKFRERDRAAKRKHLGLPKPPTGPAETRPCPRCGLKVTGKARRNEFPTPHEEWITDVHKCIPPPRRPAGW